MDRKTIVARIDQLIKEKQITPYQIQNNADISSTIYQWRKNPKRDVNRMPSLRSIIKICNFLGVSLAYFFTLEEDCQRSKRCEDLTQEICKLPDKQILLIEQIVNEFKSQ